MAQEKIFIPTDQVSAENSDTISAPIDAVGSQAIENLTPAHDMSMIGLFLQADIIVQAVMLLLLIASIVSWTIIFSKLALIKNTKKKIAIFLNEFWEGRGGKPMEEFYHDTKLNSDDPLSRVFVAGMYECYEKKGKRSPLNRAERALNNAATREINNIEKNIGFLATVGSAAPFIGLFGTVWGIMNSFQSIAVTNNTSLAVVAPGIAEALFATAIGLFAAIPAVIFYNKFSTEITKLADEVDDFVDELVIYIEREFE
jgi:biopolymer transport protein TolQ